MGGLLIPIPTDDMSKYFDYVSVFYDFCDFILHLGLWNIVANESLEMIHANKNEKVLDVATGTGKLALRLSDLGCKVWGIDLSQGMLDKAIKKDKKKRIKFIKGDATKLQFSSNTFDICTICSGFHEMSNNIRKECIKEMIRVLKPNAKRRNTILNYATDLTVKLF